MTKFTFDLKYETSPLSAAFLYNEDQNQLPPIPSDRYAILDSPIDSTNWKLVIEGKILKDHEGSNLLIGIYNPQSKVVQLMIQSSLGKTKGIYK